MNVIIAVVLAINALLCLLWWRLLAVSRRRAALIRRISDMILDELQKGDFESNKAHWANYDSVSYVAMWLQFWKPVSSFYREFDFWIPPDKKRPERRFPLC